jgi:hypothetical protein
MVAWGLVGRKPQKPQKVTTGRFEMEHDGQAASLEYSLAGNVLELIHTEDGLVQATNLRFSGHRSF